MTDSNQELKVRICEGDPLNQHLAPRPVRDLDPDDATFFAKDGFKVYRSGRSIRIVRGSATDDPVLYDFTTAPRSGHKLWLEIDLAE